MFTFFFLPASVQKLITYGEKEIRNTDHTGIRLKDNSMITWLGFFVLFSIKSNRTLQELLTQQFY